MGKVEKNKNLCLGIGRKIDNDRQMSLSFDNICSLVVFKIKMIILN